jgi:hypothetical protein
LHILKIHWLASGNNGEEQQLKEEGKRIDADACIP